MSKTPEEWAAIRTAVVEAVKAEPAITWAELARRFGLATTTVKKWVVSAGVRKPAGSPADAARAQNARSALAAELATRRANLADRLLSEAEALVESLHKEHMAYNFGGKDNTYAERLMPEPDVKSKQIILVSVGIALDKHMALKRYDSGQEAAEAGSLLASVGAALVDRFGDGSAHRKPAPAEPAE